MILIVDHRDSFTHNLVQALRVLGADVAVAQSDEMNPAAALAMKPAGILLSPGPCTPADASATIELVKLAAGNVPLLGVCLGHQAIAAAFGAKVVRAQHPRHGKSSMVEHEGAGSLAGLPSPFEAGRYHSLVVDRSTLPSELAITAEATDDGNVMAFFDAERDVEGVQFHPESVLTPDGPRLLAGWLARVKAKWT